MDIIVIFFLVAFLLIAIYLYTRKNLKTNAECGIPYKPKLPAPPKPTQEVMVEQSTSPCSERFIKPEKDRIVTDDEVRHTAYLIAAADGFKKNPDTYWCEAEKQLKG